MEGENVLRNSRIILSACCILVAGCERAPPPNSKEAKPVKRYELHQAYGKTVLLDTATGCVEEVFVTPKKEIALAGSVGFNCEGH